MKSIVATAAGVGATLLHAFVPGLRNRAGDSVIKLLGNVLLSGYGRDHVLEADRLGTQYLARTGYNPQAMIKVIGVRKSQELFDAEVAKPEGRQPRASPLRKNAVSYLRLINSKYPGGEPVAGQPLKVIE